MSVVCSSYNGWIISHELYIENVYQLTLHESSFHKIRYASELFKIITPFKGEHNPQKLLETLCDTSDFFQPHFQMSRKRKKVNASEEITGPSYTDSEREEVLHLQKLYLCLIEDANKVGYFSRFISSVEKESGNEDARKISSSLYLESSKHSKMNFHGANNTNTSLMSFNNNEQYIFPPHSEFFCYDIKELENKLNHKRNTYDLILLDPPWWNKYIRRKKSKCTDESYQMMYNEDIAKIPVSTLLAPGALVAVWCTNSPSHINALQNEIFPAWGIEYIGTWYWLKITQSGEPVCPFTNPRGKQPYERIMFGHCRTTNETKLLPENGKMILSVPSAIHSQKPPLAEVLSAYLPAHPKCLELFARYLLPRWTSWGNEVLKLQHMSLFKKQPVIEKRDTIHDDLIPT